MKAKTLMLQGTSSDVGKSVLATGLCRIFYRMGYSVAPFKAQNMALNSYVTMEGGEMGRAQVDQARAAGMEPSVDMNPVLLKPEGNSRSQVVVMGRPMVTLSAMDYHSRKVELWRSVTDSLDRLGERHDLIVIEGAGSPAEINLKANDIVNMRVASHLGSPVLLVGDIDRGGVFASLYGTLELLEEKEKELVRGFIINKFRGDLSLVGSGLDMLLNLTGKPTLGVIPYLSDLGIAQEDSVFLEEHDRLSRGSLDLVAIRYPRTSNYDDLDALAMEPDVGVRLVDSPCDMGRPDGIILPGSKSTVSDLLWMRENGLEAEILALAGSGVPVVGICGGFQMMGRAIWDGDRVESSDECVKGMGLLDSVTSFKAEKRTVRTKGTVRGRLGFFGEIQGVDVEGYEIHMGRTDSPIKDGLFLLENGDLDGIADPEGLHWGTYLHGIFDLPDFRRSWLRSIGWRESGHGISLGQHRNRAFDRLADHMEEHMDMGELRRIVGL
ncbi:cobyric acid synthase [Dethiosulfovibrio sp. F2B]|uniref:cobyric acid synthase n=1 Tax=Dethiosulfovibrio faecalis TaxID=2720018 RepID=UPI001F476EB9|nr:cobyric acid synthase [Dethiosulfovibrio faecalis]MCF4151244.1 cobyric acid synthase [Dethiosulfovibrio faecalis]